MPLWRILVTLEVSGTWYLTHVPFLPCGFHPQNRPMFRSFPADFIRKTTHLSTSNLPTSFRATNRYRSDVTGIGR
jgi:hypothetical protein